MKSLPGSQPLLGETPLKLVAGILGRSYDATPYLARSGSWFWRRGSWWWCRPRLPTSSLLLCSPRFLSAPALLYSSSFCYFVLLTVSFFFSLFFLLSSSLSPPSTLASSWCCCSRWFTTAASPLQMKMIVWKGCSTNTSSSPPVVSSVFFFAVLFLLLSPLHFCLVPPLAFIAKGCMRYGRHMVTAGVHYSGEEISRETCPWLQLHRSRFYRRNRCLKTVSSVQ